MALFDEDQRRLLAGIAIGVGVSWAAKELLTPFKKVARPLAKAGIKSGIIAYERGRETVGHLTETVDDLVAEVKAEQAVEDLAASAVDWEPAQEEE